MGCVWSKCCIPYLTSEDSDESEESGAHPSQSPQVLPDGRLHIVEVPSHGYCLLYSALIQRGNYPGSFRKESQSDYSIVPKVQNNPNVHFFGVFDGHGLLGDEHSSFAKVRFVELLSNDPTLLDDPVKACRTAFLEMNYELRQRDVDHALSSTAAITVLVIGDMLYVANAGNSKAVLGVRVGNGIRAPELSCDQTLFRQDKWEKLKLSKSTVLCSTSELKGLKDPVIQSWGDDDCEARDSARLQDPNRMYSGTVLTQSAVSSMVGNISVIPDQEVSMVQLTPSHPFFVIASHGLFKFLSIQAAVEMVDRYADPRDACSNIAQESHKLCLEQENQADDMTIIVVWIDNLPTE